MSGDIDLDIKSLAEFAHLTSADITVMPRNVAAIGWVGTRQGWIATGDEMATSSVRLAAVVKHLDSSLRPDDKTPPLWLFCCVWDGWRERIPYVDTYRWVDAPPDVAHGNEWQGAAGELPRLSPSRDWVACFAAHRGDPSAVLLPEAYFLRKDWYRRLMLNLDSSMPAWELRRPRASYAGGAHEGNFLPMSGPDLRRRLPELVKALNAPVDVHLGKSFTRREQVENKYLLDIDGFVRTWDAWAWKLLSGSVVLSPESHWETWFTRQFEPWAHFVPLAADLCDIAERIEWCRANDDECRHIASEGKKRALEVYDRQAAEHETAEVFRPLLGIG